jgi:hypothetical protein
MRPGGHKKSMVIATAIVQDGCLYATWHWAKKAADTPVMIAPGGTQDSASPLGALSVLRVLMATELTSSREYPNCLAVA